MDRQVADRLRARIGGRCVAENELSDSGGESLVELMATTMIIESDTLRLRPPNVADAREWLTGEDDEIARWFEFPRRSTQEDAERAIQRWIESWRLGGPVRCWAICDRATGAIMGGVELRQIDETDVNLSYWVSASWRRRGIATRAAELALNYAASAMHSSRAVIKVLEGNVASIAVAKRLNAQLVGTTRSDAGGTFLVFHRALKRDS
jgi:RimJ/RimL family protein N-acetyltransferase